MFRRLESGLPKDASYPASLEGLGYFVNDHDEIRSINDPKAYFKFFLTKNDRFNCVQREAMNETIRNLVSERLVALGLSTTPLPLGAKEHEKHVPIFTSSNLSSAKRVVLLFYESNQDIGVFAHRIIGGKGGINEGSAVNLVKYIQSSQKDTVDGTPGIIIANLGQLRWWRRGKKAITQTSWYALPQNSAVDSPFRFDEVKNTVPGNRSTEEHVEYIFNSVVPKLINSNAKLDIIGVSEGANRIGVFLEKEENFKIWGERVSAFAALATIYHAHQVENKAFGHWLRERGRAYVVSDEPSGTFISGPDGNRRTVAHGCPVFSLGEPYYVECMLPKGFMTIVDWFQEVAADPNYANPELVRFDYDDEGEGGLEQFSTPGIDFNPATGGTGTIEGRVEDVFGG